MSDHWVTLLLLAACSAGCAAPAPVDVVSHPVAFEKYYIRCAEVPDVPLHVTFSSPDEACGALKGALAGLLPLVGDSLPRTDLRGFDGAELSAVLITSLSDNRPDTAEIRGPAWVTTLYPRNRRYAVEITTSRSSGVR